MTHSDLPIPDDPMVTHIIEVPLDQYLGYYNKISHQFKDVSVVLGTSYIRQNSKGIKIIMMKNSEEESLFMLRYGHLLR